MGEPMRIQLSRARGWRMPLGAVKVDRSTAFGNPFTIAFMAEWFGLNPKKARQKAVDMFRRWHAGDLEPGWTQRTEDGPPPDLEPLRGKNLACWCALDQACHADVLLDIANRPVCEEVAHD